ncbi:fimbrial protein [Citrobacter farmeri]|uniref:fimbrial protein n=1 Tax=Citrobacter farmeri TaxID=67824 RepID=UPI002A80D8EE|nr:fimbrial protein [Citrobacter farmeri]
MNNIKIMLHISLLTALLNINCAHTKEYLHTGTVYVTGKITDKTCSVSPDSNDFRVDMRTVATKTLNTNHVGDWYPFAIKLEKCKAISEVSIQFEGTADSGNSDILAIVTGSGMAAGVGVGIYNQDKTLILLGQPSTKIAFESNQEQATLQFYARYVTNGENILIGAANASATFTLTYA